MRSHNQGTLFKKRRRDGSVLYVAKVSLPDGRRIEQSSVDKKKAEGYLTEMLRKIGRGVTPKHRLTVASFLDGWVSDQHLRDQTMKRYQSVIDVHLKPGLGHFILQTLRPSHVEDFLATRRPATGQQCRSVLRNALNAALRDRLVEFNAAELARPIDYRADEATILSLDEWRHFLDGVADDRLHGLWLLACTTAMREAELLGLAWQDVGWKDREIKVVQQLIRGKGEWSVGPPKSRRGKRTIAMSSVVYEGLRAHLRRFVVEHNRIPDGEELVFTTERGLPLYGYRVVNLMRGHLERLGIPKLELKLHELRHTAASFMVGDGIPEPAIREALGQSTVRLLMDTYAHALPGQNRMVAERMQALLRG